MQVVEVEVGVRGQDLQVLGGQQVHDLDRGLRRVGDVDRAPVPPGRTGDVPGGQALELALDLDLDLGGQPAEVVTRQAGELGPCSAWASRSAATISAVAVSSAITATSDGPASTSMPTLPYSCRFASAT